MKKLLLCILLLSLSGCSTMKDKFCDYQIILPKKEPIEVDKRLLEECEDFVVPVSPVTWESLLINARDNKSIHKNCMLKQKASIIVLKQVSNNK